MPWQLVGLQGKFQSCKRIFVYSLQEFLSGGSWVGNVKNAFEKIFWENFQNSFETLMSLKNDLLVLSENWNFYEILFII